MAGFNSFFPQDENVTDGIVPVAGTGDIFVDSPISVDTATTATTFAFGAVNITQVGTVATIVPSTDLPPADFSLAMVGDVLSGITGGREFTFTAVSLTSITATRTAGGTGTVNNDGGTITRAASGSDGVTVDSDLTVTGTIDTPIISAASLATNADGEIIAGSGGGSTVLLPSPDVIDHNQTPVLTTNTSITLHPTINMLGNIGTVELSAFYYVGSTTNLETIINDGTQTAVQTLTMPSAGVQATILIDGLPRSTTYSILIVVAFPGGYYVSEIEEVSTPADASPSASITVSLDGGAEATADQTPDEATALVFTLTAVDNEGDDFTIEWQRQLSLSATVNGAASIGDLSINFDDPTTVVADALTGSTFTNGSTTHTISGNTGNSITFTPELTAAIADDATVVVTGSAYVAIAGETESTYTVSSLDRGIHDGRFRARVTPGAGSTSAAVNSNDIGISIQAAAQLPGRASISRTVQLSYPGNTTNTLEYYPWDHSSDAFSTVGGNTRMVLISPAATGVSRQVSTGTVDHRFIPASGSIPGPIEVSATYAEFGGLTGVDFSLPSTAGNYGINSFSGALNSVTGTRIPHGTVSGNISYQLNITLVGLSQWTGNAFYTAPTITNLQTVPLRNNTQHAAGFFSLPVAAGITTENIRLEASRGGVVYADANTRRMGLVVTTSLNVWGLSWCHLFMGGGFYGNPSDFDPSGSGAIDVTITVVT